MKRSYIADEIVLEYKRKKAYQRKKRENCKEKKCTECKYQKICEESEKKDEV